MKMLRYVVYIDVQRSIRVGRQPDAVCVSVGGSAE